MELTCEVDRAAANLPTPALQCTRMGGGGLLISEPLLVRPELWEGEVEETCTHLTSRTLARSARRVAVVEGTE